MLKIENLKLFSIQKMVLSIPTLSIDLGQFVTIQGANSTGKTLLLNTLGGSFLNYTGSITLKKQPLSHHLKSNTILLIDGQLPVIEQLSFLDNIQLPFGKLTTAQKNRLLEMVNILGCIDILNVKMISSSRSERATMYLLRCAMISPSLLLIDDLDTFFDPQSIEKILQFILYCAKSGIIILATVKDNRQIFGSSCYRILSSELVKV